MNRANQNDSWIRSPDGSLGFTSSFITGCWKRCSYCFAMDLARGRLKSRYLANDKCAPFGSVEAYRNGRNDPFWPRVWAEKLDEIYERKKPAGIFLNIMGDWAHAQIPVMWKKEMFDCIRACPQHVFYLLTKQYDQLPLYAYPDNCWVGASVTDAGDLASACLELARTRAKLKFLSVEPLLGLIVGSALDKMLLMGSGVSWVIVGAATGKWNMLSQVKAEHPELTTEKYEGRLTLQPPSRWVTYIIKMSKDTTSRVFLKNNLYPSFSKFEVMDYEDRPWWVMPGSDGYELRQEVFYGK